MKNHIKIYGVKDAYIKYLSQYQEHLFLHEGRSFGRFCALWARYLFEFDFIIFYEINDKQYQTGNSNEQANSGSAVFRKIVVDSEMKGA